MIIAAETEYNRARHEVENLGRLVEDQESAAQLLLISIVRLTGLCLPYLEQSTCGRIVNVTSSTVREPIDNLVLSNVLRPGVIGWA